MLNHWRASNNPNQIIMNHCTELVIIMLDPGLLAAAETSLWGRNVYKQPNMLSLTELKVDLIPRPKSHNITLLVIQSEHIQVLGQIKKQSTTSNSETWWLIYMWERNIIGRFWCFWWMGYSQVSVLHLYGCEYFTEHWYLLQRDFDWCLLCV